MYAVLLRDTGGGGGGRDGRTEGGSERAHTQSHTHTHKQLFSLYHTHAPFHSSGALKLMHTHMYNSHTHIQHTQRLLYIIIAFLRQAEPRPTWRVIVGALRRPIVNLTALARRVEAAHFSDLAATRDVVPGKSSSVPLTQFESVLSF